MSFIRKDHERDDEIRAARAAEGARVRRWDGHPASLRSNPVLKIRHVIASMQYTRIHLKTDAQRAAYVVNHMPVISHIGLDPVAGLYAEALLFGDTADERTLARECLLAAAAGFPLKLAPSELVRAQRWNKARTRAQACVTATATNPAEADAARDAIAAATLPDPALAESIDPDLLRALRGFARHNPEAREESVLHLTVGRDMQSSLSAVVHERLTAFDRVHETAFCASSDCEAKTDALVVIAEITDDGLPLRAVVSTRTGLLFGPVRHADNGWVAVFDRLGNASLNKLLLILPQARSGDNSLCNRALTGFHNLTGPDGVDSCDPATGEGLVTAREALKVSMNLPWIDAARQYHDEVTGIEDALGFGRYSAPAAMTEYAAALVNGGKSAGLSPLAAPVRDGFDAGALGYSPADVATAADWFTAPTEPGGTMHAAAKALAMPGCQMTHGKSGTFFSDGRNEGRFGLAIIACGERRFVTYAGVSGRRAGQSIGSINQVDLVSLYRVALKAR